MKLVNKKEKVQQVLSGTAPCIRFAHSKPSHWSCASLNITCRSSFPGQAFTCEAINCAN